MSPPVVVSLRGGNGAGKSTLVRAVMGLYAYREPTLMEGRIRPLGYVMCRDLQDNGVFVIGHYEGAANGGLDNISPGAVADLAWEAVDRGESVLAEGRAMTDRGAWLLPLLGHAEVHSVLLEPPWEECARRCSARRRADGSLARPTIARIVRATHRRARRVHEALVAAGARRHAERDGERALELVRRLLNV